MCGYVLLFGWPTLWPSESSQWFFYLALCGSLWDFVGAFQRSTMSSSEFSFSGLSFLGRFFQKWKSGQSPMLENRAFFKVMFLIAVIWLMFQPIFESFSSFAWRMTFAVMLVASWLFWWSHEKVYTSLKPSVFFLNHSVFTGSLAGLLVLTGSASLSQMIGVLAAGTGALFLVSLFQRPTPYTVSLLALLESLFCLYAYHYVEVTWWYLVILCLSLLVPYSLKIWKPQNPWVELFAVGTLSGLFAVTSLGLAFFNEGPLY